MTQRERQILNWIEADPMISQQELADRAGITRSSVAVHISNLMKKGCIAGKGYIVTRSPYVTVVGGMNMDIGGRPYKALVGKDSNPGTVRMSPGGVGRNIAHNMSLMGLDVRLVTAFGDDVYAQKLAAVCGELGIDISQSPDNPGAHTTPNQNKNHHTPHNHHLPLRQRRDRRHAAGGGGYGHLPKSYPPGPLRPPAAAGRQPGGGAGHQPPGG